MWFGGPGDELPVPPGRYSVTGAIDTTRPGQPQPAVALITSPQIKIDREMTITLDSRQSHRVKLGVDRPAARATQWSMAAAIKAAPGSGFPYSSFTELLPPGAEAHAGVTASSRNFRFNVKGIFQEPLIRLDVEGRHPFPVELDYLQDDEKGGSPKYLGTHRQEAVYGGKGDPGDLPDVHGKLVVLDWPDGENARYGSRSPMWPRRAGAR
jgi:hypothetical protein